MQSKQQSAYLGITIIATFGFAVLWFRQTSETNLRRMRITQILHIKNSNSTLSSNSETLSFFPNPNSTLPSIRLASNRSATPQPSKLLASSSTARDLLTSFPTLLPSTISSTYLSTEPYINPTFEIQKLFVFPTPAIPRPSKLSVKRLLPIKHWIHRRFYPQNYNQITCTNFPRYKEIHYAAASWQHLKVHKGNVYLYGAHWDGRFEVPVVRVLIYSDVTPLPKLLCQFWYENENGPITVPSTPIYGWRKEWGGPIDEVNEPYLLTCNARRRPPLSQTAPAAVSIIREGLLCGTPTNVLNIQGVPDPYQPPLSPRSVGVCLKWLQFEHDVSAELVEWMELLKAFGANKVFIYDIRSHPNTKLVLDYYSGTGFADVTQFVHPPHLRLPNVSAERQEFFDYRRELLPLNDCMYRSIGKYQWLAAIDLDEIIVPFGSFRTWQQILTTDEDKGSIVDAIAYQNYFFLDAVQKDLAAPPYMKKLGHFWRTKDPDKTLNNVKGFHSTSTVVTMHNHFPISCSDHWGNLRNCHAIGTHTNVGRLYHYRWMCDNGGDNCEAMQNVTRDDTMKKWTHVRDIVDQVLTELGIKPKVVD